MLPSAQNSRHELGHLAAVHLSLGDYVLTGAGYPQALPMRLWGTASANPLAAMQRWHENSLVLFRC